MISPPSTEIELLARARPLAGLTLGQLAVQLNESVPADLRRAKGWVGVLLERALGATARSKAAPDFEQLGVELKTLPVSRAGVPLETTFVCTIDVLQIGDLEWEHSRVWHKLRRVLWVPVLGERQIPVAERQIGSAVLWSPSPSEQADLRWDWEELAGLIGRGGVDDLTGHLGKYLQVRPKAANSRARRRGVDEHGRDVEVMPRGFYLRTAFTARILRQHLALPSTTGRGGT